MGVENEKSKKQMSEYRILFVCTGNTCRSPMAEALAQDFLRRGSMENAVGGETEISQEARAFFTEIKVFSAGTGALDNEPASVQAQEVMAERGLDLSRHLAKTVTQSMLREADLILTMTQRQKEYLEAIMPEIVGKVFLLKNEGEIGDPFGQPVEAYRQCADELTKYIPRVLEKFLQENSPAKSK